MIERYLLQDTGNPSPFVTSAKLTEPNAVRWLYEREVAYRGSGATIVVLWPYRRFVATCEGRTIADVLIARDGVDS